MLGRLKTILNLTEFNIVKGILLNVCLPKLISFLVNFMLNLESHESEKTMTQFPFLSELVATLE